MPDTVVITGSTSGPAQSLAAIAAGEKKMRLENQHRNVWLHLGKRLLTGKWGKIDVEAIEPRIVEPEHHYKSPDVK